ncbi:hypothetical protein [Microbacterium sp.]|uniref:hypothetical protein n=1 Tax=Microbacterium sp. TaxID=51671 RepID=UPI00281276E7|nr:hypothetical protein [Microbacterium sp.]
MIRLRTIAYRPFHAGLRAILFVGPAILLLVGLLNTASPAGWIVAGVAVAMLVVITFFSGVRIRADETSVAVSLVPFWGKRLRWSDVTSVVVEDVRPFEDFGGWGIKGTQKKHGILLSAGDTRSIRFTLIDGRRYLVAVGEGAEAAVRDLADLAPRKPGDTRFAK